MTFEADLDASTAARRPRGEAAKDAVAIGDEAAAIALVDELTGAAARVEKVVTRPLRRSPAAPFTTSTLQQEASRKLGFSPKRTMSIAQRLYEGVETDGGQVGLITYMRTDSTAIAGVAMGEARAVIGDRYGESYTMPKGRVYKTKSQGRPGGRTSRSARRASGATRSRWRTSSSPRSSACTASSGSGRIASQMAAKEMETTSVDLEAGRFGLRASATRTLFDGFSRVYTEGRDDDGEDAEAEAVLPPLVEGDRAEVRVVTPAQHFTEPPPRFTEATLIKALEEHGIGRPSTYAATISTIVDRGYVSVRERRLFPELVAGIVTDLLVEHFGEFVDVAFTARMEERLDEVARGERAWVPLLRDFYEPLKALVDEKRRELKRRDFTTEATDEVCSLGHPMVIRLGRNGRFLACSLYPEHKDSGRCRARKRRPWRARASHVRNVARVSWPSGAASSGPSSAAHATPTAATSSAPGRRRPTNWRIRSSAPRTVTVTWWRDAHAGPATSSTAARRIRPATTPRTTCRSAPSTRSTTVPSRSVGDAWLCLKCGAPAVIPDGSDPVGLRLAGGAPDPTALQRPRVARGGANGKKGPSPRRGGTRKPAARRSTRARASGSA